VVRDRAAALDAWSLVDRAEGLRKRKIGEMEAVQLDLKGKDTVLDSDMAGHHVCGAPRVWPEHPIGKPVCQELHNISPRFSYGTVSLA